MPNLPKTTYTPVPSAKRAAQVERIEARKAGNADTLEADRLARRIHEGYLDWATKEKELAKGSEWINLTDKQRARYLFIAEGLLKEYKRG